MLVQPETVRESLADYFEQKAQWRQRKAEQYPHDTRNQQSVVSLELLAKFISTLSDDDPVMSRFTKLASVFENDCFEPPRPGFDEDPDSQSATDAEACRCGFDSAIRSSADCLEWLNSWAAALEAEAAEYRRSRAAFDRKLHDGEQAH